MLGFALLAGSDDHRVKYAACFLVTSGIYANVPQGVAWNGNNIGGSFKRAVGLAMHAGCVRRAPPLPPCFARAADGPRRATWAASSPASCTGRPTRRATSPAT